MMPRSFALLLLLAFAGVTAGATTTSTTLPGGRCAGPIVPLCRIDIRLADFRDAIQADGDALGRHFGFLVFRVQRSARCLTRATALCDGRIAADEARARRKLRKCASPLVQVQERLRSRPARRVIPADVVTRVASEVAGIANELEAARDSLTCP
jgi:hypothetical protein